MSPLRPTASPLLLLFLTLALLVSGCTEKSSRRETSLSPPSAATSAPEVSPVKYSNLGTVAVTKVNIDHPTARLVFRANGVSDTIVRHLQDSGSYRVIDWVRLEEVLIRRNLEWSDLNQGGQITRELSDVLLNDYFLMATVTSYGEKMEFSSQAFSKSKTQVVSTTVELALKDAFTNEIIATAIGQAEGSKEITQTLGFGAAGGNDTVMAGAILDQAIASGVARLTSNLASARPAGPPPRQTAVADSQYAFRTKPKILLLFNEADASAVPTGTPTPGLEVSVAEQALAKEMAQAGARTLTAGDVVNRAYAVGGGEALLLSGWVDEKDFAELENLLQARTGLAAFALQVGRTAGADLVVSGTVRYQTTPTFGPGGVKAMRGTVYLSAKAIRVNSGDTVALSNIQQSFTALTSPDELTARSKAIELAARLAVAELMPNLADL